MSSSEGLGVEELEPSELGTKQYWEEAYIREGGTFAETEDPGEVWFGEEAAARMVNWLADHPEEVSPTSRVLDVGCGNGCLSVDLAKEGFQVVGCDYSSASIALATKVAQQAEVEVEFQECDILGELTGVLAEVYQVVVDKGTFDAISLGETALQDKKRYVSNVSGVLEEGGILLITSCNWTRQELATQFSPHFREYQVLPTPSFTFGGRSGNSVTTVVFRRKAEAS